MYALATAASNMNQTSTDKTCDISVSRSNIDAKSAFAAVQEHHHFYADHVLVAVGPEAGV